MISRSRSVSDEIVLRIAPVGKVANLRALLAIAPPRDRDRRPIA